MKTTISLSPNTNALESAHSTIEDIKSWIDSNSLLQNQNYIWRIGIAHSRDIMSIAGEIRQDFNYKHYRHWSLDSFEEAFRNLTKLNKYPFIFKSYLNDYLSKGTYLFVYKTPCENHVKRLFSKTLHS